MENNIVTLQQSAQWYISHYQMQNLDLVRKYDLFQKILNISTGKLQLRMKEITALSIFWTDRNFSPERYMINGTICGIVPTERINLYLHLKDFSFYVNKQ